MAKAPSLKKSEAIIAFLESRGWRRLGLHQRPRPDLMWVPRDGPWPDEPLTAGQLLTRLHDEEEQVHERGE